MATKIQLRRDTAADWTSNNPTMAAGEFGWESNTNRFKIGDGATAWNSLAYSDTLKQFGDISVVGSTISSPSNADLTLTSSGGAVVIEGISVQGTSIHSADSSSININDGVIVDGSLTLQTGASVTGIADEDAMGSDSATLLATQQSIKAYVDTNFLTASSTATLTNKTFDVEATGNSISNIDVANLKSGVLDTDISSVSGSDDTLASAKAIKTYVDSQVTAQDLDFSADDSTVLSIDLDSETLHFAGGNGLSTSVSNNTITHAIDTGTVVTKTDSQTLTNKTLTSAVLNTGVSGTAILDEDNFSTNSATQLATQQSIKAYVDTEISNVSIGDLSFIGSTIAAPSNADLTLTSSNGNVVIEGLKVAGTTISTEDSGAVQVAGNLIPSADGIYQLGTASRRWQILYVSAETIDVGGATIKSDGSGAIEIAATGATLPIGSKVSNQPIALNGATAGTATRPVQKVGVFVSDGSTILSDAQILAGTANLTLEFNATVEDVPVYTDAGQEFTLTNGSTLASNAAGPTLFQF